MDSVRKACSSQGRDPPGGESPLAMRTVFQWNGSTVFRVASHLDSPETLAIAWGLHSRRIEQRLGPLLGIAKHANVIAKGAVAIGWSASAVGAARIVWSALFSGRSVVWFGLEAAWPLVLALASLVGQIFWPWLARRLIARLLTGA